MNTKRIMTEPHLIEVDERGHDLQCSSGVGFACDCWRQYGYKDHCKCHGHQEIAYANCNNRCRNCRTEEEAAAMIDEVRENLLINKPMSEAQLIRKVKKLGKLNDKALKHTRIDHLLLEYIGSEELKRIIKDMELWYA